MDLKTVRNKLKLGKYKYFKDFFLDLELIWQNCMAYNVEGSDIYTLASNMEQVARKTINEYKKELNMNVGHTKKRDKKWVNKIMGYEISDSNESGSEDNEVP